MPEFFEQAHVLVAPRLAPKYPIGFGLALVPGMLVGAAALVPLLLTGLSAALLYVLCRRLHGAAVATLAFAIWLAAPGGRYRSGFFSETLTTAGFLMAWYAVWRWRERHAAGWLIVATLGVAATAITRPLTGIVLAATLGIVVLRDVARLGLSREAPIAIIVAIPVLSLLPMQNVAAGGRWWELPYDRYTRTYVPFDRMGFGLDTGPPTRRGPPEITRLAETFAPYHLAHTSNHLPAVFVERARVFFADLAGNWAWFAIILAGIGVASGLPALRFGFGTALLLGLIHLLYAHPPQWSIYYSEALPVGAAAIAVGTLTVLSRLARVLSVDEPLERARLLVWLATLVALQPLPDRLIRTRVGLEVAREGLLQFNTAIAGLTQPSIVFVRHTPERLHRGLVRNPPDYPTALVWTVHDLGVENARLLALAPGRVAYLYDERSGSPERLGSGVVP